MSGKQSQKLSLYSKPDITTSPKKKYKENTGKENENYTNTTPKPKPSFTIIADEEELTKMDDSDLYQVEDILENSLEIIKGKIPSTVNENIANEFVEMYRTTYAQLINKPRECETGFINSANYLLSRGPRPIDPNFTADYRNKPDSFITNIYVDNRADPRYLYKCYFFPNKIINIMFFLHEIVMQKYTKSFSSSCEVKIPEIYDFYLCDINDVMQTIDDKISPNGYYNKVMIIKMEYLRGFDNFNKFAINNATSCTSQKDKLNKLTDCLNSHGLFHDDFHVENVMMNDAGEIALIDFADMYPYNTNFYDNTFYCNSDNKLFKEKRQGGRKTRGRRIKKIRKITRRRNKRR